MPRRRSTRSTCSIPSDRGIDGDELSGTMGSVSMERNSAYKAVRPDRAGNRRTESCRMMTPPNRSPIF